MNEKIAYLKQRLKEKHIDGMIVTNNKNIHYLANIPLSSEGILLITMTESTYITDTRYIEEVRQAVTFNDEILIVDIRSVQQGDFENVFIGHNAVGFEENNITYAEYKKMLQTYKLHNAVETENIIERQRIVKTRDEIEKIEKACEITDKCFSYLRNYIKVGQTERQIAEEIETFFKANGADGLAFPTIVASRSKFFHAAHYAYE
jgi:Xaa-Pro aminopeptidase